MDGFWVACTVLVMLSPVLLSVIFTTKEMISERREEKRDREQWAESDAKQLALEFGLPWYDDDPPEESKPAAIKDDLNDPWYEALPTFLAKSLAAEREALKKRATEAAEAAEVADNLKASWTETCQCRYCIGRRANDPYPDAANISYYQTHPGPRFVSRGAEGIDWCNYDTCPICDQTRKNRRGMGRVD